MSTPLHRLNDRAANRRPNNGCVSATTRTSHGKTARNCCSLSPSLSGSARPTWPPRSATSPCAAGSPLMLRADAMFKRLKASRLDNSIEAEMRRLTQVRLLLIDDFALQPLDATETADFYELVVARHHKASTVMTSNREPDEWLTMMTDPLLAQSAVDRLTSTAHEFLLTELRHAFIEVKRYTNVSAYGRLVNETKECRPDRAGIAVPLVGSLEATGDRLNPFRLVDPAGRPVDAVSAYLRDLQATGSSEATIRSYGLDLLRWFRFLWAIDVAWDRATRTEACDFCRWMLLSGKPSRPHWRRGSEPHRASATGEPYSASSRAHAETVLRCFYEFHLRAGTGPLINPFPLDRSRRGGRVHAHHNPMEPFRNERAGLYRPRVSSRVPRAVSDEEFNDIFARLPSNRDRALVAFYVSTGARASELLSVTQGGVGSGAAVDHGGAQGNPRVAGAAGIDGRVRVAAALPGGDGGSRSQRASTSRCGGPRGSRCARSPITRRTGCSSEPGEPRGAPRRCTRYVTRRPTGWPRIRCCR